MRRRRPHLLARVACGCERVGRSNQSDQADVSMRAQRDGLRTGSRAEPDAQTAPRWRRLVCMCRAVSRMSLEGGGGDRTASVTYPELPISSLHGCRVHVLRVQVSGGFLRFLRRAQMVPGSRMIIVSQQKSLRGSHTCCGIRRHSCTSRVCQCRDSADFHSQPACAP